MMARVEIFRIGQKERKPIKNYSLWLGPGTLVFAGDPDSRGPVSSGIIPKNTEVKVQTISGWPRQKTQNVQVRVIETRLLATDDNYLVEGYGGETVLSVGGFTLGQGDVLWVRASSFKKTVEDSNRQGENRTFQERLSI
jgi:hypothetical protein